MMIDPTGTVAITITVSLAIYTAYQALLGSTLVYFAYEAFVDMGKVLSEKFSQIRERPKYKHLKEVHHIVAQNSPYASEAREIIKKVNITVNSKINLISLKTGLHKRVHTTFYYRTINKLMNMAYNKAYNPVKNKLRVVGVYGMVRLSLSALNREAPY